MHDSLWVWKYMVINRAWGAWLLTECVWVRGYLWNIGWYLSATEIEASGYHEGKGVWLLWVAKIRVNVSSKVVERSASHFDKNFFQMPFSFCMGNKVLIKH